jgi:hypothetical protein
MYSIGSALPWFVNIKTDKSDNALIQRAMNLICVLGRLLSVSPTKRRKAGQQSAEKVLVRACG